MKLAPLTLFSTLSLSLTGCFSTLGKAPADDRLKRIQSSPNYRDGAFQNINPTSMNREGGSTFKTAMAFFFTASPVDIRPGKDLPSIKTDLNTIASETPSVVWFGHSSYLIAHQRKNILVDPVFSGNASPISTAIKSFGGANTYQVEDLPKIDVLVLTHDHYDHIDFDTVTKLKEKVGLIICPLGVGAHLEYWGFKPEQFVELDWWDEKNILSNAKITATPARHFSGRSFTRNQTLWASYALELGQYKIFIGGDSGYDNQFKKIGEKFKSFDLALLESGQYGENWPYIHMFPEQTVQAAVDLNAKVLMPVHWGKFVLSVHSWTEPIERVLVKSKELNMPVTTPQIGEVLTLDKDLPNTPWWRNL